MAVPGENSNFSSKRYRVVLIVAACATVVPIFVAAVRDGLNGFYPTLDVAATVLRARDTFSTQPPLIGMWSAGSSWAGHEIHFPGATELYILAPASQILGNTWGPLLAMAVLNSAWILLAGWLIYRRLGTRGALVGFMLLAMFVWSLGSENLIDPAPVQMVTIPFLTFLVAVWAVADGDRGALPALAIVANYLYLSHLVLALLIPVIALCAVGGQVLWAHRARRLRPDRPRDGLRRPLIAAGVITVVMWLPSIIQELRGDPGNLTLLFQALGQDRESIGSFATGARVMIDLIATPPFWLRGTITDPQFLSGNVLLPASTGVVIGHLVLAFLLIGAGAALAFTAWRRRDRRSLTLLAVAAVAVCVSSVNVAQAPSGLGFPVKYLRSAWGVAAFVWLAVAWNLMQLLKPRLKRSVALVAGGLAVVLSALALPYANFGAATDMEHAQSAQRLVELAVPKLIGHGPVYVRSAPSFPSQRYFSTLMLGLDAAGVPYCVSDRAANQYGAAHACADSAATSVLVYVGRQPDIKGGTLIAQVDLMTADQRVLLAQSTKRVQQWLGSRDSVRLAPKLSKHLQATDPAFLRRLEHTLAAAEGDLTTLLQSDDIRNLITVVSGGGNHISEPGALFADASTPQDAFATWVNLDRRDEYHGAVWVIELPHAEGRASKSE